MTDGRLRALERRAEQIVSETAERYGLESGWRRVGRRRRPSPLTPRLCASSVIARHVSALLTFWSGEYQNGAVNSNAKMYGSLFAYLKKHGRLLLLLKRRGLFHLFESAFMDVWGSKAELDNASAYTVAFVSYGTYGWIEEWIARGMQESVEEMTELLSSVGMM